MGSVFNPVAATRYGAYHPTVRRIGLLGGMGSEISGLYYKLINEGVRDRDTGSRR